MRVPNPGSFCACAHLFTLALQRPHCLHRLYLSIPVCPFQHLFTCPHLPASGYTVHTCPHCPFTVYTFFDAGHVLPRPSYVLTLSALVCSVYPRQYWFPPAYTGHACSCLPTAVPICLVLLTSMLLICVHMCLSRPSAPAHTYSLFPHLRPDSGQGDPGRAAAEGAPH